MAHRRGLLAATGVGLLAIGVLTSTGGLSGGSGLPEGPPAQLAPPASGVSVAADPTVTAVVTPTGVVLPVVAAGPDGYEATLPCGGPVLLAATDVTPLVAADVLVDPGHGGDREPGAVAPNTGQQEADLNLVVADLVARRLEEAGLVAIMSRYGDHRMPIERRAQVADALGVRAVVSVHHNAARGLPQGPTPGTEVFHQVDRPDSQRLAGLLQEEIVAALAPFGDSWSQGPGVGASPRPGEDGQDFFGILRRPSAPAALTEAAYLSDPEEALLLARPDVQQAEADAIARAVVRFLTTDDPGSGFVAPPFVTRSSGGGGGLDGCVDPPLTP